MLNLLLKMKGMINRGSWDHWALWYSGTRVREFYLSHEYELMRVLELHLHTSCYHICIFFSFSNSEPIEPSNLWSSVNSSLKSGSTLETPDSRGAKYIYLFIKMKGNNNNNMSRCRTLRKYMKNNTRFFTLLLCYIYIWACVMRIEKYLINIVGKCMSLWDEDWGMHVHVHMHMHI